MKLPPLTAEELEPFVKQGRWIAKLATQNQDHSMRITPLTYGVEDAEIVFSTWENSDAVRNIRRDARASVLIDKADPPYAGVHYTGRAHASARDHHTRRARQAVRSLQRRREPIRGGIPVLTSLGLGDRPRSASVPIRPSPGTSTRSSHPGDRK